MSKSLKIFLISALLASVFVGCGGKVEENYIMTTVREASRGDLLSPGFKYSFDNPNIIAAYGNMALIREGNLIEFLSGDNIEGKLAEVQGRRFTVGARKIYSPRIHFTCDTRERRRKLKVGAGTPKSMTSVNLIDIHL